MGDGVVEVGANNIWNKINSANSQLGKGFAINGCCGGVDTIITELTLFGSATVGFEALLAPGVTLGFTTLLHSGIFNFEHNDTSAFQVLAMELNASENFRFSNFSGNSLFRSASFSRTQEIDLPFATVTNDDNRIDRGLWLSSANCVDNGTGPLGNWIASGTCNYGSAVPVTPPIQHR